jgi:hypothetical protein
VTAGVRHEPLPNWHTFESVSPFRPSTTRRRHIRSVFAGAPALPVLVGAGDPGSSRLVYAMVIGLIGVGIAFIVLAVWLIRQTRYDLPVLAPLERMGDKDWRRQSDPATQRRILDEVRPDGAQPIHSESSPPSIDAEFELADRPVASMSDLAPSGAEIRSATPHGLERPDMLDLEPPVAEARSSTPQGLERPDMLDLDSDLDGAEEEPTAGSVEDPSVEEPDEPLTEETDAAEDLASEQPTGDSTEEPSVEESEEPAAAPVEESSVEPSSVEPSAEGVAEEPDDGAAQGSTDAAER